MNKSESWFSVDTAGLRELQESKPKSWVLRELLQNAFDELIMNCKVTLLYDRGRAFIEVEDDSMLGFRNIADAYTLFGKTYKRADPHKRGRFNIGEKQAICLCEKATVITTTGMITFNDKGRHADPKTKTEKGSKVSLIIKMTKKEFEELTQYANEVIVPMGIHLIVNDKEIEKRHHYKEFFATLMTEMEKNGSFVKTQREVSVYLYKNNNGNKSYLYEMGIPVQEIDCEYGIDIQQKVPLTIDRDSVLPSFLQDVYAEVLNQVHNQITPETSSKLWVRSGASDDRVSNGAVTSVIKQRYGDKVVVASPNDPNANDEAISRGYKVVYGSEMSADEWGKVKESGVMPSSSNMFGARLVSASEIIPDNNMSRVGQFAKDLAKRLLALEIQVKFVQSEANVGAEWFNETKTLVFNTRALGLKWFENKLDCISLILHEIGHSQGNHTEHRYHQCLTDMAQVLVGIALHEPEFFRE